MAARSVGLGLYLVRKVRGVCAAGAVSAAPAGTMVPMFSVTTMAPRFCAVLPLLPLTWALDAGELATFVSIGFALRPCCVCMSFPKVYNKTERPYIRQSNNNMRINLREMQPLVEKNGTQAPPLV